MKTYNKLVRDRIPEIILASGKLPVSRAMEDEEYRFALRAKLVEEAREVAEANDAGLLSELADLAEVLDATIAAYAFTHGDVRAERDKRNGERGAFTQKMFLERVE